MGVKSASSIDCRENKNGDQQQNKQFYSRCGSPNSSKSSTAPEIELSNKKDKTTVKLDQIIEFYKVDCDKFENIADIEKIQVLPTIKFYKDGKTVDKMFGDSRQKFREIMR